MDFYQNYDGTFEISKKKNTNARKRNCKLMIERERVAQNNDVHSARVEMLRLELPAKKSYSRQPRNRCVQKRLRNITKYSGTFKPSSMLFVHMYTHTHTHIHMY